MSDQPKHPTETGAINSAPSPSTLESRPAQPDGAETSPEQSEQVRGGAESLSLNFTKIEFAR